MSQNGANIFKKPPKGHISSPRVKIDSKMKFGKCIDIEEVLWFFFFTSPWVKIESKLSQHESKETQTLKKT